jgi:hypothetical protein
MKQNRTKQGLSIILEVLLLWNGIGSLVTIRIRDKKKRSRRGRRSSRNRYYTRSVLLAAWNGQKQAPTLLLQTRNGRWAESTRAPSGAVQIRVPCPVVLVRSVCVSAWAVTVSSLSGLCPSRARGARITNPLGPLDAREDYYNPQEKGRSRRG